MKKALELMKEEMKKVDIILYVLDSRTPKSCINPSFNDIVKDKPIIYIFNKFDLCDEKKVRNYAKNFRSDKTDYIFLNSTKISIYKFTIIFNSF